MAEHTGWLLDVYPDPVHGQLTIWTLGDDGERRRLQQHFPVTFYAGGPPHRLHDLCVFLKRQFGNGVRLERVRRQALLDTEPLTLLAVTVRRAAAFPRVFGAVERPFVDVPFYDTDIRLQTRYTARFDVFPMCRCRVATDPDGWIREIEPLDSRWDPEPASPPLRVLALVPNTDPFHAQPKNIRVMSESGRWQVPLRSEGLLMEVLGTVLRDDDPDVILTRHGDAWMLPYLAGAARRLGVDLPLNRDPHRALTRREGGVHHVYGQVVRRGPQALLHGRLHIDLHNTLSIGKITLEGILETARLGGLPVQTVARTSPGATLTALKMITYLRRGWVVPNFKQQTEDEKDILTLTHSDKGGLIFAPVIGLHPDVVEVDFTSMFPWIAWKYDISPETLDQPHLRHRDPRNGAPETPEQPGMLGETLAPLLAKRQFYKTVLAGWSPDHPEYDLYKSRLGAHKAIGVVAYGRTKFRKETDGKVEVHESITDFARKSLVLAKLAAEDLGYRFLHGYVDALYLQRPEGAEIPDLLDAITRATGLPIVLEGEYRWMAFLPSKRKPRIPAANRFFGVTAAGELKVRGLASRRGDMPEWIIQAETAVLEILARAPAAAGLPGLVPEVIDLLRDRLRALRAGEVDPEELVVTQKLSKAPEDYRVRTSAVRAARQLHAAGKTARIADHIRYVFVRGEEKVRAWDLPERPDPRTIDVDRYEALLLRAAHGVLQMVGVEAGVLRDLVTSPGGAAYQLRLFEKIEKIGAGREQSPLPAPIFSNPSDNICVYAI